MHRTRIVYRFGPFELDGAHRRLFKGNERVHLADRPMDILLCLVASAGRIVDKDTLITAAWHETAVSDDSLRQAVNAIRRTLGGQPGDGAYIEARVKRGYEFTAPVQRDERLLSDESLEETLDSFRAFVTGRAALESLDLDRVVHALGVFETLVRANPVSCEAHLGYANACFLAFEATRIDLVPDVARLGRAEDHARRAVRLNPQSGDAWGTFALVRHRLGNSVDAMAAARKAIALEPNDWLHHLRHAAVSWGQERIRAAGCALALSPDLALARWLAATVYVARGLFERALEELRLGCAQQDAQLKLDGRVKAVGLHWLCGLVLAAVGHEDEALIELERELASGDERHVYGRECAANCWYAVGALRLRHGKRDEAAVAFDEALKRIPGHRPVMVALNAESEDPACLCADLLARAGRAGENDVSAGWLIPVEPSLHVTARRGVWEPALALLRARAM